MDSAPAADFRRLCRCGAVLRMQNRTGRCWRCEDRAQAELARERRSVSLQHPRRKLTRRRA